RLDLLRQREAPERRAVPDRPLDLRPPRVEVEVQRLRLVLADLPMVERAEELPRHVGDDEPHDLPLDPARHALDQRADPSVDLRGLQVSAGERGRRAGRRRRLPTLVALRNDTGVLAGTVVLRRQRPGALVPRLLTLGRRGPDIALRL